MGWVCDAAGCRLGRVRVLSVNVGLPMEVPWHGETVRTAIWKEPVDGRCRVRRLDFDGDGQGDLQAHGGEHRAVYVYQIESYRYWQRELGRGPFSYGFWGENLTVEGLGDDEVCIGDRYRIGSALFEVTQPRVTCWRLGIRTEEPRMPALVYAHGRPGFYFRVLEEGDVGAGDAIEKVADGPQRMTVREVSALLYLSEHPLEKLRRAVSIPALSEGWKGSFRALIDAQTAPGPATGNAGLVAVPPRPAWAGFRPFRLRERRRESRTVAALVLEPADGRSLPLYAAGQFVTVRLPVPGDGRSVLRSYSLAAAPDATRYLIGVKREPHGVAGQVLHDGIALGSVIEVAAPRGLFTLADGGNPVVLLSAGVGVTPVLGILDWLVRERSPREVWWLHGARCGAEHAFASEAKTLVVRLPHGHLHVRYSRPSPDDQLGRDYDAAGRLRADVLACLGVPREAEFYLCGPSGFMRELTSGLMAWGVQPERLHTELFGPGDSQTPAVVSGRVQRAPHPPNAPPGSGPEIAFTRSALTVRWDDRFGSLLELAEACDVPVGWSCRTGVCHTCQSGLLDGEVEYDPQPLSPAAAGTVLVCCSRPHGDVALEL
jgi:ferredoxin-NADP reductase/MOSC domain-containing protein YiiM